MQAEPSEALPYEEVLSQNNDSITLTTGLQLMEFEW